MKKVVLVLIAVGISVGLASFTFAQEGTAGDTRTPVINKRQRHQQRRIYQGVRSGELTRRETVRLQREQYGVRRVERKAKSDGTVTARERARLHREQNQASRHIYRAKHNGRDRN